jgi:hypothetical protein
MRGPLITLLMASLLCASIAPAAEVVTTYYGGASVVGFTRRETRRYFDVPGTITLAFDQYSADLDVVLIHTTAKGTCLDRGRLGEMGWIELSGRCAGLTGLILESTG